MIARDFCLDVSFYIVSVLRVTLLEAKSATAYIFTFRVTFAIRTNTFPVVYYVTVLTVVSS